MFGKRLDELTKRKRHIVMEAGLHRSLVELECASVRVRFNSSLTGIRTGSPWLKIGGMVAGLLAERWRFRLGPWIPTLLAIWRWIRGLK